MVSGLQEPVPSAAVPPIPILLVSRQSTSTSSFESNIQNIGDQPKAKKLKKNEEQTQNGTPPVGTTAESCARFSRFLQHMEMLWSQTEDDRQLHIWHIWHIWHQCNPYFVTISLNLSLMSYFVN